MRTPACGTFTPTFGSAGSQYSRRSSNTGTAAWPRIRLTLFDGVWSENESDLSSPNGAS